MSNWSRRYDHNNDIQLSEETQQYIQRLQNGVDRISELTEDNLTQELMNRIDINNSTGYQPKEVREAHKVIQNWLKIENEARYIRHNKPIDLTQNIQSHIQIPSVSLKYISSNSIKTTTVSTNPLLKSEIRRKQYKLKCIKKQKQKKKENTQFTKTSIFNKKFAFMKKQALNRQNKQKSRNYRKQLVSSNIDNKQIVERVFELKEEEEEESINNQVIENAELPIFDTKINENKEKYLKKLEIKNFLLIQLNEIEKQEKFHNKKLIKQIFNKWKIELNKTKEMEQKAINMYYNNLLNNSFNGWFDYTSNSKEIQLNVFREWIKLRLISQHNEIKATEFYEDRLQDNILFYWRDYTKDSIEQRRIRSIQLQTRLYKMEKIAKRHHKYLQCCKIIKYWKVFVSDQQNERYLISERNKRKLKMEKLIHSVKQKTIKMSKNRHLKIKSKKQLNNIKNKISKKNMISKNIQTTTIKPKTQTIQKKLKASDKQNTNIETKMISHSIQTDIKQDTTIRSNQNKNKFKDIHQQNKNTLITSLRKSNSVSSLKPSKMLFEMEKRALDRKEKRRMLIEIKQKKQKHEELMLIQQKKQETEKIKKQKQLEYEEKQKKFQKQMYLKKIEKNKLFLSKLHFKKSLMIYYGWIPWMKYIEQRNIIYHKIIVIHNNNSQKLFWSAWKSVINYKKSIKINAQNAAMEGRERMSNKLFIIKIEKKYFLFWKDQILKYKMMSVMLKEKQKLNIMTTYLKKWQKAYELKLNKKQMDEIYREELATKQGNIVLMKRIIKSWKKEIATSRREKIKARSWRKVELWLSELRAKR